MRIRRLVLVGPLMLAGITSSASAQDLSWQNQWYWGVQGGAHVYSLGGGRVAPTAGAHWFITAGRSALYLAYEQQFMQNLPQTIRTGQSVTFGAGQRFQASVYAVPSDSKLQVMLGGGFAINRITDAQLAGVLTSALDERQLDDAATKAFLILSGGWQYRTSLRTAIFGLYQYMPGSNDFVIRSAQHSFSLGIRYAVTHSQEVVSTER